ncbi:MAG: hypothetical protein ACLFQX_04115 [Candidatus Kapaibacterium sp.]
MADTTVETDNTAVAVVTFQPEFRDMLEEFKNKYSYETISSVARSHLKVAHYIFKSDPAEYFRILAEGQA